MNLPPVKNINFLSLQNNVLVRLAKVWKLVKSKIFHVDSCKNIFFSGVANFHVECEKSLCGKENAFLGGAREIWKNIRKSWGQWKLICWCEHGRLVFTSCQNLQATALTAWLTALLVAQDDAGTYSVAFLASNFLSIKIQEENIVFPAKFLWVFLLTSSFDH